jgi:hypothetical protein
MRFPPILALPLLGALTACGGEEAPTEGDTTTLAPSGLSSATDLRASVFSQSTQSRTAVDAAADGTLIAVWDSRRQEAGTYGVYARVFDADGWALSDEVRINQTVSNMQQRPSVAAAADGTAWFAWESHGQDGEGAAVVARQFQRTATGELMPAGDEIAVNQVRDGDQAQAVLAAHPDGPVLAVYTSQTQGGAASGTRFELRARRLDIANAPEQVVASAMNCSDELPSLAASGDGFVIAWTRRHDGDQAGVYYRRLGQTGVALGDAVRAGDVQDAIEPSIGSAADGSFVVAWMAPHPNGYSVQSQRFDAQGAARGKLRTLATPDGGWLSGAAIACADDGRHVVAFNRDLGAEQGETLIRQHFAADGAFLGESLGSQAQLGRQAMTAGAGVQRAVWTSADRVVLAWDGDAGLGDASAAHLSLLNAEGAPLPPAEALALASTQAEPALFDVAAASQIAIPPIWDPNWVPQDRLIFPNAAAGDFGFEAVPGTGWTPPDPEMAVGPDRIGVMTNGRIAIFDKNGVEQWRDEIESSFGFWGAQGATGFVFDPEICWDPHNDRFVAMACERSSSGTSEFLLAVSKDATPDNANDWHKYRLNVTSISDNDIDSPNLSVSQGYVLLTADFFGPDGYLLYIIDKNSIYSGGAPVTAHEYITGTSQQSMGIPVVYDNTDTLYVLQSTENSSNTRVIFHAITDPFTSYNRQTESVTVQNYSYPNQPPQKGSSSRPFLFEPRFWSVAQRNGKVWAVHHINNTRARVRWYEFELNGWPSSAVAPSVRQFGNINLGGDIHTYFPSIHVDGQDNAAITFARSAPNEYISMGRVTRSASDPLNTMRPAQVVQVSNNAHTSGRWGDYSGTQADPTTDGVFWGHHEFTNGSTGSWRTWVARYDMRPEGLLLAEDPITAGTTHTLSVTGATPGARVFFVYSTDGTELTEVPALSITLSVKNPTLIKSAIANAGGAANISRPIPPGAAGLTVWVQAAEFGESSNWYSTVIQ